MTQDATETDLQRLDALRDEDIDYSDIPELDLTSSARRTSWHPGSNSRHRVLRARPVSRAGAVDRTIDTMKITG